MRETCPHLKLRECQCSVVKTRRRLQLHLVLRGFLNHQKDGAELGVEGITSQVKCAVQLLRVESQISQVVLRAGENLGPVPLRHRVGETLRRVSLHQNGHLLVILKSRVVVAVIENH